MKSLRKSLNGNKDAKLQISTPLPIPTQVSKPSSAILPPQKVIRALTTYKSQAPQELSFSKGDFFYVLKDPEDSAWYEAHNPVTGSRGIVPRAMFEEFSKNAMPNRTSQFGGAATGPPVRSASSPGAPRGYGHGGQASHSPKSQVYYAIVMHDFVAERPDELDAKRGDAITVVAQSNREWFVAKPIGRLGRPGLIPVSFVEIHDPSTGKALVDVNGLIDRGDLPKVEEWKRAMLSYKQNSISLGVIDTPSSRGSVSNNQFSSQEPYQPEPERPTSPECLPEGILLSADVVSFHYEMEEYWFRIDATFQPYGPPGQSRLPKSKQLILFRVYNDFYDFQVSLLNTFPREAGREPPHPRTLPFMPGPATDVDDALTASRREELDEYVHALCALGRSGGRYILEHTTVRQFLALKPGDIENEGEPRTREIDSLLGGDNLEDMLYQTEDYVNEMGDQFGRMDVKGDVRGSQGSDYEDEGYAPSPQQRPIETHPYSQGHTSQYSRDDNHRMQTHSQHHSRSGSSASFHTQSTLSTATQGHNRPYTPREERASPTPPRNSDNYNGQSRWGEGSSQSARPPTASSFRSNSPSSRARSHSNANLTNPPISAANPQTAFVKIKIFDRIADDLIAIRVHPKVSHAELMDKVHARLGSEVTVLKYRDSMTNAFVGLDSEEELRAWMDGTDKHVLYAD